MKIQIDGLRKLVLGHNLNLYQKKEVQLEFDKIEKYLKENDLLRQSVLRDELELERWYKKIDANIYILCRNYKGNQGKIKNVGFVDYKWTNDILLGNPRELEKADKEIIYLLLINEIKKRYENKTKLKTIRGKEFILDYNGLSGFQSRGGLIGISDINKTFNDWIYYNNQWPTIIQ